MRITFIITCLCLALLSKAQTFTDAEMMGKREVCLAAMYMNDAWHTYYEADIKRTNGNIGTLTRQTAVGAAVYGISQKLTFISMLPYVHT
ncbi:MAG TPA: hypothetical protein PK037_09085, partial [Saprospiraceae bacterium]|nr:hypothetical protein [Saprospiraceae bacterium]